MSNKIKEYINDNYAFSSAQVKEDATALLLVNIGLLEDEWPKCDNLSEPEYKELFEDDLINSDSMISLISEMAAATTPAAKALFDARFNKEVLKIKHSIFEFHVTQKLCWMDLNDFMIACELSDIEELNLMNRLNHE